MFKVTTSAGPVAFTFSHEHYKEPAKLPGTTAWVKASTMCELEYNGIIHHSWAYCSVKDTFNKDKARKVALAKAMDNAELSKEDRTLVWDRYHMRWFSNIEYNNRPIWEQLSDN